MSATQMRERIEALCDLEVAQGFLDDDLATEADRLGMELQELEAAQRQAEAERNGDHSLARHIRSHRVRRAHNLVALRPLTIRPQASRASRGRPTRVRGSRRAAASMASGSDPPGDPEPGEARHESGAAT